jgi:hypothetical protein
MIWYLCVDVGYDALMLGYSFANSFISTQISDVLMYALHCRPCDGDNVIRLQRRVDACI